jgi:hypothetical protein
MEPTINNETGDASLLQWVFGVASIHFNADGSAPNSILSNSP